jgi:hypothetical protein
MKAGTLITIGVIGIIVLGFVFWAIGVSNSEKKLYLTGKAAQQNCEVVFDNTWKKIQQQAGVTNEYKEGFRQVYVEMMNARYSDEGQGQQTLMKWIQESNPTLDASIYKTLMNTIEGSRNEFTMEQKKLIDIDRQHKSMKATFPNSLIIGGRPDLEIKLVTSAKTEAAFESGQDNDVDLFPKKDEPKK